MRAWAKVGLGFVILVFGAAGMQMMKGSPKVGIQCNTKGDSGTCVLTNNGSQGGNVKVDVILVCKDGDHAAFIETPVQAGNHVTKIIDGFKPAVGLFSACAGIDYRNMEVKPL